MHTNLAVERKARTFLRMEHFRRSKGPDDAKSYFMDYEFLTTSSYVFNMRDCLESQNHLVGYDIFNVVSYLNVLYFLLIFIIK
jgi:hypothetical protein